MHRLSVVVRWTLPTMPTVIEPLRDEWHNVQVAALTLDRQGKHKEDVAEIKGFHNIECRDTVLAWDRIEYVTDETGRPITRWDGRTYRKHPVTGEDVPDENARVPLERYVNPRKAEWPQADFVVGNPPFIGTERMRSALGHGHVDTLRATWTDVPESADYVM